MGNISLLQLSNCRLLFDKLEPTSQPLAISCYHLAFYDIVLIFYRKVCFKTEVVLISEQWQAADKSLMLLSLELNIPCVLCLFNQCQKVAWIEHIVREIYLIFNIYLSVFRSEWGPLKFVRYRTLKNANSDKHRFNIVKHKGVKVWKPIRITFKIKIHD